MNKYHARERTCRQGHAHHSTREAVRCDELTIMERARLIVHLQQQPVFELQKKFEFDGVKYRAVQYIADFSYFENEQYTVEDVKGMKTPLYLLKKRLFLYWMNKRKRNFKFLET